MDDPIRILIADEHTLFHEGVRTLLNAAPDLEVIGEAATGDNAIGQAAALLPDVILMDIQNRDCWAAEYQPEGGEQPQLQHLL